MAETDSAYQTDIIFIRVENCIESSVDFLITVTKSYSDSGVFYA